MAVTELDLDAISSSAGEIRPPNLSPSPSPSPSPNPSPNPSPSPSPNPDQVCCDLIVASVCCSGGQRARNAPALQEQLIPIPVEVDRPLPGDPRGGPTPPQYPNGF